MENSENFASLVLMLATLLMQVKPIQTLMHFAKCEEV
jgi:hypothetical protein